MKYSRSTFLAMLAAGSIALLHGAPPALAGVVPISWTGGGDGTFHDPDSWDNGVPGIDDDALFDGQVDTVTFTENAFSANLSVIDGSDVTFELGGFTYAVTNHILIDDSILTILDGVLSAESATINNGGEMNVGADATFNVTGNNSLIVGDDGVGDLNVLEDGTVNAANLIVGNQAGGDGTVGVEAGGSLNTGTAILGNEAGAAGAATVAGEWTTVDLVVGNEGDGTVTVEDGGLLISENAVLGAEAGGTGVVTIDGDDGEAEPTASSWSNSGTIIVGDEGGGELNITNGGNVSTNGLSVGHGEGGVGEVNIGADSTLNSGSAAVGTGDDSTGEVNVAGTWQNSGNITVGHAPGNGNGNGNGNGDGVATGGFVTVENTGVLTTGSLTVGTEGNVTQDADGVLIVTDGDVDLDALPDGGLYVGFADGNGAVNVVGGGQVSIADSAHIGTDGGTGVVTVSGDDGDEVAATASTLDITGDLVVGDEGTGTLNVENGGLVNVGGDASVGANDEGGTGTINVDGEDSLLDITGELTLGHDAGLGGAAETATGTLMVTNGGEVTATGGVTVNETGLLGGDGIVMGNVTVHGRLAPGASIGTLEIQGNLDLEEGGILQIEVDSGEIVEVEIGELTEVLLSDSVHVTGTATLADGSVIQIIRIGGPAIQPGDTIIILEASTIMATLDPDGVLEEVTIEAIGTAFINWLATIIDENGDEFLVLEAIFDEAAFEEFAAGLTGNLRNVVDALLEGGVLFEIPLGDDPEGALATLLPLQHGTAALQNIRTAQIFNNAFFQEMSAHRRGGLALGGSSGMMFATADPAALSQAIKSIDGSESEIALTGLQDAGTWGGFIRGLGIWESVDSSFGERVGHRARIAGVQGGVHTHLSPEFMLGLNLGYLNTDLDFRDGFGDGEIHTFRVGPYASLSFGELFIDASVTYGYHRNEIDRETVLGTARSRYDAHDISVFAQGGFDFLIFDFTTLTPIVGLEFTHLRTDSFTESGAGAANLAVSSTSTDSLRLRLGAKLAHVMDLGGMTLVPELYVGWAHEFLDRNVDLTSRFIAGGPTFATRTQGVGRDSAQVAAGVSALVDPNMAVFIRYEGEFARARDSHGIVGGLNINF